MRTQTHTMHEHVEAIGRQLGFDSRREVSLSPALDHDGYAPRLDIAWSLELSAPQHAAIRQVGALVPMHDRALLVAAWEVEGSDVSTRGTQADLANIKVSGAAYGFVALRGGTVDNIHERARKAARTQRHYFGHQDAVILDARWLAELAGAPWSAELVPHVARGTTGGGGEGGWAGTTRHALRELGERAGFDVSQSYRSRLAPGGKMTLSQIDVVWSLRMPRGLLELASTIAKKAKDKLDDELVPARFEHVAVVAFELENDASKHAGGGILNLSSHAMAGVFVAGTRAAASAAESCKRTYRDVFPLARVTINAGYAK